MPRASYIFDAVFKNMTNGSIQVNRLTTLSGLPKVENKTEGINGKTLL